MVREKCFTQSSYDHTNEDSPLMIHLTAESRFHEEAISDVEGNHLDFFALLAPRRNAIIPATAGVYVSVADSARAEQCLNVVVRLEDDVNISGFVGSGAVDGALDVLAWPLDLNVAELGECAVQIAISQVIGDAAQEDFARVDRVLSS